MITQPDSDWDELAEVLVIGYGMAGAVAAITASDEGAKVIVIDKQPEAYISSTSHLSGGLFLVSEDMQKTLRYMQELNKVGAGPDTVWTDPDIVRVWAERIADNKNWMQKMGGSYSLTSSSGEHDLAGADSLQTWRFNGMGSPMMRLLYEQCQKRGVAVRYATKARKFITNFKDQVVGVNAQTAEGKQLNLGASRAVILATGGFEFNENMKLTYLKVYPAYFMASPASTGDGIRMAMDIGADLWHMSCCSAAWMAKYPGFTWGFRFDLGGKGWASHVFRKIEIGSSAGYMVIDQNGRRFTNENYKGHSLYYELGVFDSQKLRFPRIPCYWIFDRRRMEAGPLPTVRSEFIDPLQNYQWSKDNATELGKGWIVSANSPGELAQRLNVPTEAFEKTLSDYNKYCLQKRDVEFNRRVIDLVPLDTPPFYAVSLWPGGVNTQGGPRRNARSQILNTDGEPIPGLYGAGECGSIFGMLYPQSGGNLSECIAFGRVAGENAAKEENRNIEFGRLHQAP